MELVALDARRLLVARLHRLELGLEALDAFGEGFQLIAPSGHAVLVAALLLLGRERGLSKGSHPSVRMAPLAPSAASAGPYKHADRSRRWAGRRWDR